jgi:hypothetical protein
MLNISVMESGLEDRSLDLQAQAALDCFLASNGTLEEVGRDITYFINLYL